MLAFSVDMNVDRNGGLLHFSDCFSKVDSCSLSEISVPNRIESTATTLLVFIFLLILRDCDDYETTILFILWVIVGVFGRELLVQTV